MHRIAIVCTLLGFALALGASTDSTDGLMPEGIWLGHKAPAISTPRIEPVAAWDPLTWETPKLATEMPALDSIPEMPKLSELPPQVKENALEALLETSRKFIPGAFPLPANGR